MDILQALLQALHDNPSDETSWLVLADWLEESGQAERGRMIRRQHQLRGLFTDAERAGVESAFLELLRMGVRACVPTLTNSVGMVLALIPPGTFWLGSPESEVGRYPDESPRRLIELTRPFYLGIYPVTQDSYRRVIGSNPSSFCSTGRHQEIVAGLDTSRFPVEEINWAEADAFCKALSELPAERKANRCYRLPTEIEWEYACRGGAMTTAFPYGKRMTSDLANFKDVAQRKKNNRPLGRTSEVGSYPPNGFGLFDMVGNVWEWCSGWYDSEVYAHLAMRDPQPPEQGDRRTARGGNYNLELRRVRSADRSILEPDYRGDCGLRVLCEWTGKKS